MAGSAVVGILKALLTCDSSEFTAAMSGASKEVVDLGKKLQSDLEPRQRAVNNLVKEFLGGGEIRKAQEYAQAVADIGGADKLVEQDQLRVNKAVADALTHYRALGQEAPKNLLDLELATRRLPEPLDQTNASMGKIWSGLKSAAGLIGITFTAGAVVNFATKVFDAASAVHDNAIALGFSAEGYQRNKFAAEQSGSSLEGFTRAAQKLNDALGEGSKSTVSSLKAAGLSFDAIRAMKPEDAWTAVTDAVGKIEDPLERARVAQDLFGKGALELLPGMIEGYKKLGEAATVMSNETIARLEAAQDAWGKFSDKITIVTGEFIGKILEMNETSSTNQKLMFKADDAYRAVFASTQDATKAAAAYQAVLDSTIGKAKMISPAMAEMNTEFRKGTQTNVDYAKQLREAIAAMNALTPAQRASIVAGVELGKSTSDIAKEMSLAEDVIGLYRDRLTEQKKAQEEATRKDKERSDALKALTSDVSQLSQAQRDQIVYLITAGKSEGDIAKAYGYTAQQVKDLGEAMKEREALGKFLLADGLAREKANADARVQIWQRMEQDASRVAKRIARNYFEILDVQAAASVLSEKRTMADYDFQVSQIIKWGEAQKRGFLGSIEQTAAYYDAIDALTREKLAAIDPWTSGLERTFGNLINNIDQALISITGGWDDMWAGMKRAAQAFGQDIIATVVHTFLDPLLNVIIGKQSAFAKAWAGLFSGMGGVGGAAAGAGSAAAGAGSAAGGAGAAGGGGAAGAIGAAAGWIALALAPLIIGQILNPELGEDPRIAEAQQIRDDAAYMGMTLQEYLDYTGKQIPEGFAGGGYIPATPGGRRVTVAEGGQGEWLIPDSKMAGMGALGSHTVINNTNDIRIQAWDGVDVDRVVRGTRFKRAFHQATTDDRQFASRVGTSLRVGR